MWTQDAYLKALDFAAKAHLGQTIPGGEVPYTVHLCQVAMEVMAFPSEADDLAVCCALLHDTLEDTSTTYQELEASFGKEVAQGVQALTKNESLPKAEQMSDSLTRILQQAPQVWMVKMGDRIINMGEPPHYWTSQKRQAYRQEAESILQHLSPAHSGLSRRLRQRIDDYGKYIAP